MNQIDLEPKEYHPKDRRREPILVPGAPKRVLIWLVVFVVVMVLGVALHWAISPFLEPASRAFAAFVVGLFT